MGIHRDTLDFMWESLKTAGISNLKGVKMMELGNQIMRQDVKDAYGFRDGHTKVYFLQQRCNHHAIDWNGQHGAVPLDMCKPIKTQVKRFVNQFDVLTDFGCMEHYRGKSEDHSDHLQSWKNIHDMGKVGCVYVHTLPYLGSVPGHGSFHFNEDFFNKLCKANNYKILFNRRQRHDARTDTRDYAFCSYIKVNNDKFQPGLDIFKEWLHR